MKARFLASIAAIALATPAAAQQAAQVNEAPGGPGAGAGLGAATIPPVTDIRPDTAPGRTLGTVVGQVGNRTLIGGGTLAGTNLFHSFAHFDLGQGDTAAWVRGADAASISHVINRVTGGDPSLIFGTIDSTALPNADFWFINPSGILFGEGARLDVPASARFSTAQEIRFASGPAFTVATPTGSTFSVADPRAFGFVGGQGSIVLGGVDPDFVTPPGLLMLAGRDVTLGGSGFAVGDMRIYAFGGGPGEIDFEDVRPADFTGRVAIDNSTLGLAGIQGVISGVRMVGAEIAITDSTIASLATFDVGFGASILLQAADVRIEDSFISTETDGRADAGDLSIFGERIAINGSLLTSQSGPNSSGATGNIDIGATESILLEDGSFVTSTTQSARRGGDVRIAAPQVDIVDTVVTAGTLADGPSGDVSITGTNLGLRDESLVSSATSANGAAGTVLIDMTGRVDLDRSVISSSSTATFDPNATGRSGTVLIRTPILTLAADSMINTSTSGDGPAGLVTILADDISLVGDSSIESRSERGAGGDAGLVLITRLTDGPSRLRLDSGGAIRSDTSGDGDAGGIFIDIDQVDVLEWASISSSAFLPDGDPLRSEIAGSAGAIFVRADRLTVSSPRGSDALITSESTGRGAAGLIELEVGRLEMEGQALITTDTSGSGPGGNILIDADDVSLFNRALISSSTNGSGDAGFIEIHAARSVSVDAGSQLQSLTRFETGRGGAIRIDAPLIQVTRFGQIASTSSSSGPAGTIELTGARLLVDTGGMVTSSSEADGAGGRVDIRMGEVTVAGGGRINADSNGACLGLDCAVSGPAGDVFVQAARVTVVGTDDDGAPSTISSDTHSEDDAGNVTIEAGELVVDGGSIGSGTSGRGNAGTVSIDADTLTLRNGGQITTSAQREEGCNACARPTGDAGSIAITAGQLEVTGGSLISSSTGGAGDAGTIGITAGSLRLENGRIATSTLPGSTGGSGIVALSADTLDLLANSGIETISNNGREAGGILIEADRLLLVGPDARITSSNLFDAGGDAGGIFISSGGISLLGGARLTSSSVAGAAGTIEIFMPNDALLLLNSTGSPSLITTSSGPGTGGRIVISNPYAIISNGGAILSLGDLGGANVQISTQFFISSADRVNLVLVDGSFLLEAQVGDVSSGTVERDLSVVDASGVLRGQCAAVRATGQVSQLIVRPTGPYGARPAEGGAAPPDSCF